jgi:uncharacterized protein (DUF736 family)
MTQIGLFEATPDGYAGRIRCLKIDAEVRTRLPHHAWRR